jgi:hypothetical protein
MILSFGKREKREEGGDARCRLIRYPHLLIVIPAKAGIQKCARLPFFWIPAFAGMTDEKLKARYLKSVARRVRTKILFA